MPTSKPTLMFIHGTGVRQAGFAATMRLLSEKAAQYLPNWQLAGCYWGGIFGVELGRAGASIPGYDATGSAQEARQAQMNSRWILLAGDPLIEVRVAPDQAYMGPSPGQRVWSLINELPAKAANLHVSRSIVPETWVAFVTRVLEDFEWEHSITSLSIPVAAASPVVARALAAELQRYLRDAGMPTLQGEQRDELCRELEPMLGGPAQGLVGDWLLRRLTGMGRRNRGRLTDMTTPAAGDVLRYQSRGGAMRSFIEVQAAKCNARVLLCHSLGGIAAVDWLALAARPIDALITVGSQAAYLYEIDALASRPFGSGLPDFFPNKWLNFYNENDMLSYPAEGVFKGRVVDVSVKNGAPFPDSHSAYFGDDRQVWPQIARFLDQQ